MSVADESVVRSGARLDTALAERAPAARAGVTASNPPHSKTSTRIRDALRS